MTHDPDNVTFIWLESATPVPFLDNVIVGEVIDIVRVSFVIPVADKVPVQVLSEKPEGNCSLIFPLEGSAIEGTRTIDACVDAPTTYDTSATTGRDENAAGAIVTAVLAPWSIILFEELLVCTLNPWKTPAYEGFRIPRTCSQTKDPAAVWLPSPMRVMFTVPP